jgi:hypothetical protein
MPLQGNNSEKYEPSYMSRNLKIFRKVSARLNISSVSASKHHLTGFYVMETTLN